MPLKRSEEVCRCRPRLQTTTLITAMDRQTLEIKANLHLSNVPRPSNNFFSYWIQWYSIVWVFSIVFYSSQATCCSTQSQFYWRLDGRCGRGYKTSVGSTSAAQCNPKSDRPCCSDYGYCGNSPSHCLCSACVDFRNIVREESCFISLSEITGRIESPNFPLQYPLGQDCCYDIQRPSEEYCGIGLTVEDLDLGAGEEPGGYCKQDWLSLPSCVPERGTRICGNQTGQYYQYLFQPGATAIRINFHSSNIKTRHTGFRIRYELLQVCPGPFQTQDIPVSGIPGTPGTPCYTRITDSRGTINTPYYPDVYPNKLDCVYEFVRTNYKVCGIRMQSVNFKMEAPLETPFGGACTDFLHLPSCGFLCGSVNFTWVVEFQPGASSLKFHFHADDNNTLPGKLGFLINFQHETKC